jgi:hypothetical protein
MFLQQISTLCDFYKGWNYYQHWFGSLASYIDERYNTNYSGAGGISEYSISPYYYIGVHGCHIWWNYSDFNHGPIPYVDCTLYSDVSMKVDQ